MSDKIFDKIHIVRQGYNYQLIANGFHNISEGFCIDDMELVNALTRSGEFYPLTCGCGIPECADIEEPIYCTKEGNKMRWLKKSPQPIEIFSFDAKAVLIELEQVLSEIFNELFEKYGDAPWKGSPFPHGPFGSNLVTLRQTRDLCRRHLNIEKAIDHQAKNVILSTMLENNCTPEELLPALKIGNIHETPGMNNEEPLHVAAWHNAHTENIDLLLVRGADINAKDANEETPLFYAVKGKYPEIMIPYLLYRGADIEARNDYGQTPFLVALDYLDDPIPVLAILKNRTFNIFAVDDRGYGALDYAVMHKHNMEVFQMLYDFMYDDSNAPETIDCKCKNDGFRPFCKMGKYGLKNRKKDFCPPVFDEIYKWRNCNVIQGKIKNHSVYFDLNGKAILKNKRHIDGADDNQSPYFFNDYGSKNIVLTADCSDEPQGEDFCECYKCKTGFTRRTFAEYCKWLSKISNIEPLDIAKTRIMSKYAWGHSSYIVQSHRTGSKKPLANCIMQLLRRDLIDTFSVIFTILVPEDSPDRELTHKEIANIYQIIKPLPNSRDVNIVGISKGRTNRIKSGVMLVMTQFVYDRPPWCEEEMRKIE